MKIRESDMPEEILWSSFFDPAQTLLKLGLHIQTRAVVEFGCGYGTFTIAAAKLTRAPIHALDIDADMLAITQAKADAAGLDHVHCKQCDFVEDGTGLPDFAADHALLFNILHGKHPERLLAEAHRILRPGGRLAVMHWNHDPATPHGPSLKARPTPEQSLAQVQKAGFRVPAHIVPLPPHHYGFMAEKL